MRPFLKSKDLQMCRAGSLSHKIFWLRETNYITARPKIAHNSIRVCLHIHQQHQQHANYTACLPGGRRARGHVVCWRPQPRAAIPRQRLRGTSAAQGRHVRVRPRRQTQKLKIVVDQTPHLDVLAPRPLFVKHLGPRNKLKASSIIILSPI